MSRVVPLVANAHGVGGNRNRLGEHYDDQKSAGEVVDASVTLVGKLADADLDARVSVIRRVRERKANALFALRAVLN